MMLFSWKGRAVVVLVSGLFVGLFFNNIMPVYQTNIIENNKAFSYLHDESVDVESAPETEELITSKSNEQDVIDTYEDAPKQSFNYKHGFLGSLLGWLLTHLFDGITTLVKKVI